MNVAYDQISTADAAKMLKVDKTTVAYWCRNGIINFINVSDGNSKGRYMLTEDEVQHIKACIKEFGKGKWIKNYNKNWREDSVAKEFLNNLYSGENVETQPAAVEKKPVPVKEKKKFDLDSIMTTISYMQDIKERMEDIMAEYNQLDNEYRQLKQEVNDLI